VFVHSLALAATRFLKLRYQAFVIARRAPRAVAIQQVHRLSTLSEIE
jgi:hypothetical protein